MRGFLISLVVLLALPASAADITITIPNAAIPRLQALCADIQARFRVVDANWSNQTCAEWLVLNGALDVEERVTRKTTRQTLNTAVSDALDTFKSDFPEPFTRSSCGDGATDTQYGETCDDGNQVNGDGCDNACQTE